MVEEAGEDCWSSYRYNAHNVSDVLIGYHSKYEVLGADEERRANPSRADFKNEIFADVIRSIGQSARFSMPTEDSRFQR